MLWSLTATSTLEDTMPDDDAKQTYTVAEIAKMLDRGPQSVRRWIKQDDNLKAVKIGGRYQISARDLNRWWQSRGGGQLVPEPSTDQGGDQ